MAQDPIILNAFWEGTANTLDPPTTQISLFADACSARAITNERDLLHQEGPFKIAFNGCGVTHGLLGTLFASGLREEAAQVASYVDKLMQRGRPVVLNVMGLSRGGIAAIYLFQALEHADPEVLSINGLLFDPVPGDQVRSGFPWTGKNAKDVSNCAALRRVLAIYPHEPLPWISFHAPVLVAYPRRCQVEEDVWLGCHQGALFRTSRSSRSRMTEASNLSCRRIMDFCDAVGIMLERVDTVFGWTPSARDCLDLCQRLLKETTFVTRREVHDAVFRGSCSSTPSRSIVRRSCGKYLNKYHEALEARFALGADGHRAGPWAPNASEDSTDEAGMPRYMLGMDAS